MIIYKSLPAYRCSFFSSLREALNRDGVDLVLVHGDPVGEDRFKGDAVRLPWAIHRPNRTVLVAGRTLVWQPVADLVRGADLVVAEQASKLLVNYVLLIRQKLRLGPKVALWGHGANLNDRTSSRASEWIKRHYSKLAYWWFAYTNGSRDRVMQLGYPERRITVVQNAADTEMLRAAIQAVPADAVTAFRAQHGAVPGATGLFLGSLYQDKRLPFLIAAAKAIHASRSDFVLLIAGDGPDRALAQIAAAEFPFIRYLRRVDGMERTLALAAADVVLMPGLVGLAILDAFAAEAPIITTEVSNHSPEIEYLIDDVNGLMVKDSHDCAAYAADVLALLTDTDRLDRMKAGCQAAAATYTHAAMVEKFRAGILQALGVV